MEGGVDREEKQGRPNDIKAKKKNEKTR